MSNPNPNPYPDPLALSSTVLRVLTKLNLLLGALILALLIASLIADTSVMRAFGVSPGNSNFMLLTGMRLIMVIGILSAPVVHFVLTRLLMIVETVGTGNPFVAANAARLQAIAWALLALELAHYRCRRRCRRPVVCRIAARYQLGLFVDAMARGAPAFRAGARVRAGRTHARRPRRDGVTRVDHRQAGRHALRAPHDAHRTVRENRYYARQPFGSQNRKGPRHPLLHTRCHLRGASVPAG